VFAVLLFILAGPLLLLPLFTLFGKARWLLTFFAVNLAFWLGWFYVIPVMLTGA